MKIKPVLTVIFLSFILSFSARSQNNTIPNGGFENWKVDTLFEDLKNFNTSNPGVVINGLEPNVVKISGLSGFATHLKTISDKGNNYFAFIANASIQNNGSGVTTYYGGQAYSGKPDSFAFDSKYNLKLQDSSLVLVVFKKGGQVISSNEFTISGVQSDWKLMKFKLKSMFVNPDTMVVAIASSNPFSSGTAAQGSEIMVDNLRFIGGGGETVLNGEMEDWKLVKSEEPLDWSTANIFENFGAIKTATKTTDKLKGNLALKLESYAMDFGSGIPTQLGIIATGNLFNTDGVFGGFPFDGIPQKLTLDLKYFPVISSDTAQIYVGFTKYNQSTQTSNQVGSAFVSVPTTVSTYTHYEIPITFSDTPDTASVVIFAGSPAVPKSGSILYVDNLGFDNKALGIDESINSIDGKLQYQANGRFALNSNLSISSNARITLIDMSGKIVYSNVFSDVPNGPNVIAFTIPNLSKGIYAYTLQTNGKLLSNKVLVY